MAPEIKAVIEAANVHAENQRLLDIYRDEKKSHQDAIAVLNDQISMMQAALTVSKQDLKTAINAL